MIAEGLLWYDDDPRRPFSAKMAEAAQRFSERTGWAPTACEANPQTLAQRGAEVTTGRSARAKAVREAEASAPRLNVTPNSSLRPNFILVGVEVGKTPRPARKARPERKERQLRAPRVQRAAAPAAPTPTTAPSAELPTAATAAARPAPARRRLAAASAPRASA